MRVILLENLRKFGSIGDVVDVKRGFARNYLIAQKKALFASKKNIENVEKIKKDLNKKDLEKKKNAKDIADKLDKKTFEIKKLCTENKELYGSVKPTEISKVIINKTNATEATDTPYPATGPIKSPKINIRLKKDNIMMWPAVMFANNLIIRTNGFKSTPNISIGVKIKSTGLGTPGIAKMCFQ